MIKSSKAVVIGSSALLGALSLLLTHSVALAKHNGNVCQPVTAGDTDRIARDQYGVRNTEITNVAHVWCPIMKRTSGDESGNVLAAVVYDRNTSSNVTCTFAILDNDGNPVSGGVDTKSSTSSGSSSQLLRFTGITAAESGNMGVACDIPPATAGGALSYVTEFHWVNFP